MSSKDVCCLSLRMTCAGSGVGGFRVYAGSKVEGNSGWGKHCPQLLGLLVEVLVLGTVEQALHDWAVVGLQ